ncbi:hypothetical protein FA95DRAFT_1596114 [Auriscalpium vulgare]|uniref:Uncharacterized protein n=1 Tax=Auriscalpium vulgare TaxID=40419 RepID=A0ACB8RRS1_9AGAM|nr:hypothetical protein FA95DRAFT_1596114 [Auriscalpium vulgare]
MSHSSARPPLSPRFSLTWPVADSNGNQNTEGNLRLPAYRASHMRRYHPYPRYRPSLREEYMRTMDHPFPPPSSPASGSEAISDATTPENSDASQQDEVQKVSTSDVESESHTVAIDDGPHTQGPRLRLNLKALLVAILLLTLWLSLRKADREVNA